MRKFIWITTITISILMCYKWRGYPFVIKISSKVKLQHNEIMIDSAGNPFSSLDSIRKSNVVYLILDDSDFKGLNDHIPRYKVLRSTSQNTIKELKSLNFKITNGDMATVSSRIIIKQNDKIIYESGIILDQNTLGIQNKEFGWVEPQRPDLFIEIFKDFEKVMMPIVII